MGMYDNFKINKNIELPKYIGDHSNVNWQTKSLECVLTLYYIDENGNVLQEEGEEYTKQNFDETVEIHHYDNRDYSNKKYDDGYFWSYDLIIKDGILFDIIFRGERGKENKAPPKYKDLKD
jgi:hypothetical protein